MTSTQSVSNVSAPYDPTQKSGGAESTGALEKESFMKLLVTQLSAQDPLNPADSTEFVNQLTQFTSMEQLVNIKEGLDLLAITETAGTSAQMVSFIGKDVSFSADSFVIDEPGEQEEVSFNLTESANTVDIVVKDEDGKVVRNMEAGAMGSGSQTITLDGLNDEGGKLPEGTYTFEVVAKTKDGERIESTTQSNGTVEAVVFENGYPELMMEDGRKITLSQVVKVIDGEGGKTALPKGDSNGTSASDLLAAINSHEDQFIDTDRTQERSFF